MNREEYLDILKDYLKQHLSPIECSEIERDIQELILDGIQKGKSEQEILDGLGSPRKLAANLLIESLDAPSPNFSLTKSLWWKRIQQHFHNLRCRFTRWQGKSGACTAHAPSSSDSRSFSRSPSRKHYLFWAAVGVILLAFLCIPLGAMTLSILLPIVLFLLVCILCAPIILLTCWAAVLILLVIGTIFYGYGMLALYQWAQFLQLSTLETSLLLLESTLLYIFCVCLNLYLQQFLYRLCRFGLLQFRNLRTRSKITKATQFQSASTVVPETDACTDSHADTHEEVKR